MNFLVPDAIISVRFFYLKWHNNAALRTKNQQKLENPHFSLYQSGKSRADLWQFAALVALEQVIDRSNRA